MEGRFSIKEKMPRHAAGNNHDLKLTNENFICRSLLFEKKCPVNVSITPVKKSSAQKYQFMIVWENLVPEKLVEVAANEEPGIFLDIKL